MLERSRFHPEVLYFEFWQRALNEPEFRTKTEADRFRFNLTEKAIAMSTGWIWIGDHFVEDFFEVENILGIKLLFPRKDTQKPEIIFQSFRM